MKRTITKTTINSAQVNTGANTELILIHFIAAGYFASSSTSLADYSHMSLTFKTLKNCPFFIVKEYFSSISRGKKSNSSLNVVP